MKCFIFIFSLIFINSSVAQSVIEDNGKQGIIDGNGKIILSPIYDSVIYTPQYIKNFFLVKHNSKYAYVYKVTHFHKPYVREGNSISVNTKKLDSSYWVLSDFEYDEFYPLFNFHRKYVTELYMKYKKNGMYGLIYIEAYSEDKSIAFTELYFTDLGKATVFPPIYNQILFRGNNSSIFPVQKGDKFGFIFRDKSDCTDSFYINNTEIKYDTIPRYISGNAYEWATTIGIKENQRYGVLQFNLDSCKTTYKIPCECKTEVIKVYDRSPHRYSTFLCAETNTNKVTIYNQLTNSRFELPIKVKEKTIFEIFNTKDENRYLFIYDKNEEKKKKNEQLEYYENIYIVDLKNEKMKMSFLGNENVSYENYTIKDIPLLMKKTKVDGGFNYDFFDVETEKIILSMPPEKKGHHYIFAKRFDDKILQIKYYKTGKGLKKYIGYYDYNTKIYKKGKCKGC